MVILKKNSIEYRLKVICNTISISFIIGIVLSFKLWISNRFFPLLPIFDIIPKLKSPFDFILIVTLILALTASLIIKKRRVYIIIFSLLFLLLIQDQMRWQPWVYIYTLMLVPFLFRSGREIKGNTNLQIINYLQIIIIGIYFWSGIHKLNPNFIEFTFENVLTDFFKIKDSELISNLKNWGYSIPIFEIFIGLALVVPRLRNVGIVLAIITHFFILLYLSSSGTSHNFIVYPWNTAMTIFVIFLFYGTNNKVFVWPLEKLKMRILNFSIVLLIGVLPILNFFNFWDNYLSFSLYSDKLNLYYIAIEEKELLKIDKRYSSYFVEIKGMKGGQIIDVNKWSFSELNVPFYPERRVFKSLSKTFCRLGIEENKIIFLEFERPIEKNIYYSFTCKDLTSE